MLQLSITCTYPLLLHSLTPFQHCILILSNHSTACFFFKKLDAKQLSSDTFDKGTFFVSFLQTMVPLWPCKGHLRVGNVDLRWESTVVHINGAYLKGYF